MVASKSRFMRTSSGKIITLQDAQKAGLISQDALKDGKIKVDAIPEGNSSEAKAVAAQLKQDLMATMTAADKAKLMAAASDRLGYKVNPNTVKASGSTVQERGKDYSQLKTKSEFVQYAAKMGKEKFDSLKKDLLASGKERSSKAVKEADRLDAQAMREFKKEGITLQKGSQYKGQGNSYIEVSYGLYAPRGAKTKSGKSVYDLAKKYKEKRDAIDAEYSKASERLTPFEKYIIMPGRTYSMMAWEADRASK